jgi:hypothetical protein
MATATAAVTAGANDRSVLDIEASRCVLGSMALYANDCAGTEYKRAIPIYTPRAGAAAEAAAGAAAGAVAAVAAWSKHGRLSSLVHLGEGLLIRNYP